MYKALLISPMIPSTDVHATAKFLEEGLGFTTKILDSDYAICERDGLSLHLKPAEENVGQMEFYFEVDSVDSVWDVLQNKVEGIRHKEPFDRPYGMREIHLDLPHTKALMFIGQCL